MLKYSEVLLINIVDKMDFYCTLKFDFFRLVFLIMIFRLRIIDANMGSVMVGELTCALWENWQSVKQTRINIISQQSDNHKAKLLDDHDSNQSTLIPSRAPTLSVHDDRYILLPPRI
jgi:hypothetical protein